MTAELLNIRELAVSVSGVEVVSDVSFGVRPGEAVGIVGETGSGKTMTCRAVIGTIVRIGGRVDRGTVIFDGKDLLGLSRAETRAIRGRRISYIPQSSLSSLDPLMKVGRQLEETVRTLVGGDVDARVDGLLDAVQLGDKSRIRRSYPHELSGGMRQRVAIALALAGQADLIIADEPTTALDVTTQREILELLGELRRTRGMSLILVTHDLGVVEETCDRVMVMYAGITVESGSTARVLHEPAHPYTRALVSARLTRSTERVATPALKGPSGEAGHWPTGCRFAPRCPIAENDCTKEQPSLRRTSPDGWAACFLAGEYAD